MAKNQASIEALTVLPKLPDFAVLTKEQASTAANISRDTLDRLYREGRGPQRVQLSPRRVGYPVGGLRKWLKERATSGNTDEGPKAA